MFCSGVLQYHTLLEGIEEKMIYRQFILICWFLRADILLNNLILANWRFLNRKRLKSDLRYAEAHKSTCRKLAKSHYLSKSSKNTYWELSFIVRKYWNRLGNDSSNFKNIGVNKFAFEICLMKVTAEWLFIGFPYPTCKMQCKDRREFWNLSHMFLEIGQGNANW